MTDALFLPLFPPRPACRRRGASGGSRSTSRPPSRRPRRRRSGSSCSWGPLISLSFFFFMKRLFLSARRETHGPRVGPRPPSPATSLRRPARDDARAGTPKKNLEIVEVARGYRTGRGEALRAGAGGPWTTPSPSCRRVPRPPAWRSRGGESGRRPGTRGCCPPGRPGERRAGTGPGERWRCSPPPGCCCCCCCRRSCGAAHGRRGARRGSARRWAPRPRATAWGRSGAGGRRCSST